MMDILLSLDFLLVFVSGVRADARCRCWLTPSAATSGSLPLALARAHAYATEPGFHFPFGVPIG